MSEPKTFEIPEHFLNLQHAASPDETRLNIQGVRFEEKFAAATDGHTLAAIAYYGTEKDELPIKQTIAFPLAEYRDEDEYDEVRRESTWHEVVGQNLLVSEKEVAKVLDNDNFPDIAKRKDELFPTHKKPYQIALSPRLIMQLAKAFGCETSHGGLVFQFETDEGGELKPILVMPQFGGPNKYLGAIMPIRMDAQNIDFNHTKKTLFGE